MKIDNSIKGLNGQPAVPAAARAPAQGVAVARTPDPLAAQVELSRTSTKIIQEGDDFSAARVAEIRQAISEGRFQVNPEKIADGLLQSVREFLADRQQKSA
ncbi:MAG: flagellar biosynthesis anti-sigma factor FlgM [Rhodocyclaceae bacterium]|nr:flagellar biosynthesis anti-sigma factor FlgM [Rhodocyclaceae bacterium]MBK6909225.1 flagellar biosynthesis anti-sigma factor FlgM [Rhodocyclaceae bacterium]